VLPTAPTNPSVMPGWTAPMAKGVRGRMVGTPGAWP